MTYILRMFFNSNSPLVNPGTQPLHITSLTRQYLPFVIDYIFYGRYRVHLTDVIIGYILRTLLSSTSYGRYRGHVTDFIVDTLRTFVKSCYGRASYGHYLLHLTDYIFIHLTDVILYILRTLNNVRTDNKITSVRSIVRKQFRP